MAADTNKFLLIFAVMLTTVVLFQQKQNLSSVLSEKLDLETRLTRHLEEDNTESENWKSKAEKLASEKEELQEQAT